MCAQRKQRKKEEFLKHKKEKTGEEQIRASLFTNTTSVTKGFTNSITWQNEKAKHNMQR